MSPEIPLLDPPAPPGAALTPEEQAAEANIRAQVEDWVWLDDLRNTGRLEAYRGETLFVAGKQILAHSTDFGVAWDQAEVEAARWGIPSKRLFSYNVPGNE